MKKIVITYHAFLFEPYFRGMMFEQFAKLKSSGLFDACSKLHIGIVNQSIDGVQWVRDCWKESDKVEIEVYPDNLEETRTLSWLRDYAKDHSDEYVLYFHTKSIWRYTKNTEDWRRYMEYFNIENWRECVQRLDVEYDCCGVMWNVDTPLGMHPHFSGNFWWAKTSYINKLDHSFLESSNRYDREFWIGTDPNVKAFEMHNSRLNDKESLIASKGHYDVEYPRSNYERNYKMKIHVIVTVYQRSQQLARLIWDFLCQTNPNWTMSIVHDGPAPTEMTDFLTKHFNDTRIDFRSTPQVNGKWGFPNRKMMVQEVQGEPTDFMLITNDDNEYIQPFVELFSNQCQGDVGMVYCNTIHSYMGYEILHTEVRSCYIDMGSFIVRMDVAKAVGFNHEHEQADGAFAEECATECRKRGLRIIGIQKALFVHN
jgi:hypothetical protein